MSRAVSSEPSSRRIRPVIASSDCRPKTSGPKAMKGASSASRLMAIGSSGNWNGVASGAGRLASGIGRRITSIRSAASRSICNRCWKTSAERLQTIRAFSMRSQMPSLSATVIRPMLASEDRTPWMFWIRICRFGAESLSSTKERNRPRSSSGVSCCASAGTVNRKSRKARNARIRMPVLCRHRNRRWDRRGDGQVERQHQAGSARGRYDSEGHPRRRCARPR